MGTPDRRATGEGWFTSSYSNGSGSCVEVRFSDWTVDVRDTKDRSGPTFTLTADGWAAFLAGSPATPLAVENIGETWLLRASGEPAPLRFTEAEWRAFRAGAQDGEFDAHATVPAVV